MAEPTSKGGNPIDPEKFFSMTAEERAAYMKTLQDNSAIVNKMNERPKNLVDISTGEMVGRRGNFDTYKDYGLNLRHDTDLDEALSYKQGTLEKIGKSAWNNVVGFGVGIVKGVTDMYDLLDYGLNGDTDPNMVSAGLNDFKEWAKGDVYFSKKDGGVWQDIGKVLASGTLGESASMIVPGMGISSAVSKLAAITRASIMHKALAMGANVAKMDVAMGSVASAFVGNAHESLMSIQEMSKTEADRLRASGMKEEQVQEKLAEMAKEMFYTNMVNVIPEALSMYKLLSKSTRVIDKIDPLYKRFGNTITQQMLPEAGQEIVNYFSEDQYKSHADEALGIGQKRDAFDEMIMKGRIFERGSVVSGIAGALGAPVFSAGTKGFEEFKDTGNIGSSIGAAFGGVTTAQRKKVAEQGDTKRI
jgi:hypothetical protein